MEGFYYLSVCRNVRVTSFICFEKKEDLFDKSVWLFVKYLFATFCTEIVGFTLVFAFPLSRCLIYIHATDRIFSHTFTSVYKYLECRS